MPHLALERFSGHESVRCPVLALSFVDAVPHPNFTIHWSTMRFASIKQQIERRPQKNCFGMVQGQFLAAHTSPVLNQSLNANSKLLKLRPPTNQFLHVKRWLSSGMMRLNAACSLPAGSNPISDGFRTPAGMLTLGLSEIKCDWIRQRRVRSKRFHSDWCEIAVAK